MPKERRTPSRGHWGEPYPQPNALSRSAEKAERVARTVLDTVVESASAVAAIARLPSGGPVAHNTLLGWDSNASNDGFEQGHWNAVTDPRPSSWESVTTLAGVTWGELKQRYNDLVRQNLPRRLRKARSLLAHASGLPEDDYLGRHIWNVCGIKPLVTLSYHAVLALCRQMTLTNAVLFCTSLVGAGLAYLGYKYYTQLKCLYDTGFLSQPLSSLTVCTLRERRGVDNEEQRQQKEDEANPRSKAKHAKLEEENATNFDAFMQGIQYQTADIVASLARAVGENATVNILLNEAARMIDPLGGDLMNSTVNATLYSPTFHSLYVPGLSPTSQTDVTYTPDNLSFLDRMSHQSQVVTVLATELFLLVSRAVNATSAQN